jgi:hypothetical protein
MIQYYNIQSNTPVLITTVISGTVTPSDLALLKDGGLDSTTVTYNNINVLGLCTFSFTPTSTGVFTLYGQGSVLATVEVVTRSPLSYLKNIEDESIGSWQWDKSSGVMTMLRQDGTTLAQFNIVDNLTTSSRERS